MERIRVTDEWLYKYMPIVDAAIIKNLENHTDYEYQFSNKFERRMKKQIRREAHPWINVFVGQAKKAAVFIICASGLIFLLSMSVAAYRTKFFKTVKTIWEDSILYSYFTDTETEKFYINELQYIPSGYEEVERIVTDYQFSVVYENAQGEMITWTQVMVADGGTLVVDSEYDSQIEKEINNKTVVISLYSDGYKGVYCEDDKYVYLLTVDNLSVEEVCRMIERVGEHQINLEEYSSFSEESTAEDNALSMMPECILPYAETGQLPETIYLNREHTSFFFSDSNISFPESAVIIVVKKLAGRDKEVIQDKREEIINFVNHIENAEILSEAETINPDAQLLGTNLSIILLTVDSEYVLINFSVFDDNRICMDTISEKSENNIRIWIKSPEIAKEIRDFTEYTEVDNIQFDSIERIELSDVKGNLYQFAENETEQMKDIFKRANIKSIDSNCPYDINFIFYVNGEKVYAKFCNDSCRLLAVEGHYFELEEEDANWILEKVGNISTIG